MSPWVSNAVGFQFVWLAAVAGAGHGVWWAGPLALFLFAAWHLARSPCRRADLQLLSIAVALGWVLDSAWIQLGLVQFAAPLPWHGMAPLWILALWAGFALTLNHSLAPLGARPWLAALFGASGGPLAYWIAGSAWSAATYAEGPAPWLAIGLAWGVLTPALLALGQNLAGATQKPAADIADARA